MMTASGRDKDILRSWLHLLRTAESVKKTIDSNFRSEFDITISRFDVLSALDRAGRNGLRSGELSRQLFVSDGNTTQVIAKLISQGHVFKRSDDRDARVTIYGLSDEGKALFDQMAERHLSWMRSVFGELSETELELLLNLLDKLPPQVALSLETISNV